MEDYNPEFDATDQTEEPSRYAISSERGAFVPCPCCGAEVLCPDQGFDSEAEAMTWALDHCACRGANAWREIGRPAMQQSSPCISGNLLDGKCQLENWKGTDCTQCLCSGYRPELYAPEVYAKALDLWSARCHDAQEWAEFEPVAAMLSWAVRMPEPATYWEPPKPPRIDVGTCHYCGQARVLPHICNSQAAADETATALCKCIDGQEARRRMNEQEIIEELFAGIEPPAMELLFTVAELVRGDFIKAGTSIKIAENCAAKFKVKDGAVIITRSEKLEHQHSL